MKIKYLPAFLFCLLLFSLPVFSQKFTLDTSFAPVLNGSVSFLEILGDGKILISGNFTSVNGVTRHRIARLNADGSLDTSFDANWLAWIDTGISISVFKLLPDGRILIGGRLPRGNVLGFPTILRLNPNGSFDNTLTSIPYLAHENIVHKFNKINQLPNGKILVCGEFRLPNNNEKPHLARYNADGSFDSTFTTTIDNACSDVEVYPDGKYLIAGYFTNLNGSPSKRLVRFNADGSIDPSFNAADAPNVDSTYYNGAEIMSDGKILTARGYLCCAYGKAVLNSDGSLNKNLEGGVRELMDVAFQANGKAFFADGEESNLLRYNRDGTRDYSQNRLYMSGNEHPGGINAIAVTADGKVITGGSFPGVYNFDISNQPVNQKYLARFSPQAIPIKPKFDYDGDGKDDIAVWRPSDRVWYVNRSTAGFTSTQFGLSTDIPIARDFDKDGKADIAVFRDGAWYWIRSIDSVFAYRVVGQAGDIPTPLYSTNSNTLGFMVFRPSVGKFYSQGPFQPNSSPVDTRDIVTLPTDKPVIADFEGDGNSDIGVFRDGHWLFVGSASHSTRHFQFGIAGDKPVIGDFDGDLRSDYAVFRPSQGIWYINQSHEGFFAVQWGIAEDLPVPADYDGDGKTDIAIFRPSTGVWYIMKSTGGYHIEKFGLNGDIPAQVR